MDYTCQLTVKELFENLTPCQYRQCRHHVGWEELRWAFNETDKTRMFYNCMRLITEETRVSQSDIAKVYGISNRRVHQIESGALKKAQGAAKQLFPERHVEGRGAKTEFSQRGHRSTQAAREQQE
jgi:hypothetical protein